MPTKKVAIYTAIIWAATVIFSLLLIIGAGVALESASTATAETAVLLLAFLLLLDAGIATFLVFRKTEGFSSGKRLLWVAVFAVVQLGTSAMAALILLLVLNR